LDEPFCKIKVLKRDYSFVSSKFPLVYGMCLFEGGDMKKVMRMVFHQIERKRLDKTFLKYDLMYCNQHNVQFYIQRRVPVAEDIMKPTEVLEKRVIFKYGNQLVVFSSSLPDNWCPTNNQSERNYTLLKYDIFEETEDGMVKYQQIIQRDMRHEATLNHKMAVIVNAQLLSDEFKLTFELIQTKLTTTPGEDIDAIFEDDEREL